MEERRTDIPESLILYTIYYQCYHLFTDVQTSAVSNRNLPELFAAQYFDVTTALFNLFTGGWVRLQIIIVKGDLNEVKRVRAMQETLFHSLIFADCTVDCDPVILQHLSPAAVIYI